MKKYKRDMQPFGEYIRIARNSQGWTTRQAADTLGVSKTYYNNLELGRVDRPKMEVLNNIAARADGKPFPLSWNAGKGEISVGGKLYVDPKSAKQFVSFFDRNPDKQEAMTKALQSASTTAKLFDVLGLKYKLDMGR